MRGTLVNYRISTCRILSFLAGGDWTWTALSLLVSDTTRQFNYLFSSTFHLLLTRPSGHDSLHIWQDANVHSESLKYKVWVIFDMCTVGGKVVEKTLSKTQKVQTNLSFRNFHLIDIFPNIFGILTSAQALFFWKHNLGHYYKKYTAAKIQLRFWFYVVFLLVFFWSGHLKILIDFIIHLTVSELFQLQRSLQSI